MLLGRGRILILVWLTIVGAAALALWNPQPGAAQSTRCVAPFLINATLSNGARWSMCWEERLFEGIVLYDVYYTPPGNPARLILGQAGLAELHVPYDDNSARFFDVSVDGGLGGNNLQDLALADCPGGTLRQNPAGKNVLCQTISNQGYAYKYASTQNQATALALFSVSAVGLYNYVPQWKFYDDGAIEPSVASTGRLVRFTADSRYGWPLTTTSSRGTSHAHNFWWRLDFDLDGPSSDLFQQIQFSGSGNATRPMTITSFTKETRRTVSAASFRSWRVRDTATSNTDGHSISYELIPESSHVFRGPNDALQVPYEPWTASDIYLTTEKPCEQLLVNNPAIDGCGSSVTQFANGEAVTDLVLWYGTSFHHLPRDEDQPNMSAHWSGFQIVPRDMTATNPR